MSTWTAGDGSKQVPVAGLLTADPSLRDAVLPREEWESRLADYLSSDRT